MEDNIPDGGLSRALTSTNWVMFIKIGSIFGGDCTYNNISFYNTATYNLNYLTK